MFAQFFIAGEWVGCHVRFRGASGRYELVGVPEVGDCVTRVVSRLRALGASEVRLCELGVVRFRGSGAVLRHLFNVSSMVRRKP
jgi:hypothetical protein